MKIHFLGTNGWYNTNMGETSCVFIDAAEAYIILDAGNAFHKVDKLITDSQKPVYLFLSHFHLDHTYGLHILPKFRVMQGITLISQPGSQQILTTLINKPFSGPLDKLQTKIRIQEVDEGKHTSPLPFECRFLVHADPCLGYRLTLENKIVTYLTDTGVCPPMLPLAQDADLLITECAWRVQNQIPGWPHLAPEDAATVARDANVKQLALMHFDAHNYPSLLERQQAEATAQKIFTPTRVMHDDDTITL